MQLPSFITRALAFFTTAEAFQAKVEAALGSASTAQAEVARLTSELAARDATISANAAALADFDGRVAAEVLKLTAAATSAKDAAEADAKKAKEDLAALVENPSEQARRILAQTGTVPAPKAKVDSTDSTMPRAEFSKLKPAAQSAFVLAGGKITN